MVEVDADPADLELVRAVLAAVIPGREVRAFGSRVHGGARRTSDLDLVVMGPRLPLRVVATLRSAFENSPLTFPVDVVEWEVLQPTFQALITKRYVVVQHATDGT